MKKILVAPLNWGLGHATRCIPIIYSLQKEGFEVLLASDGAALHILQKEFPNLKTYDLPCYRIKYPTFGSLFKWKMIINLPHFYKTMREEKKTVQKIVAQEKIDGIISDGRLGVRHDKIPSVYITHQLNVLTGSTTFFSRKLHQKIIKEFDVCWVPDVNHDTLNHSGKLGHLKKSSFPIKYFGIISRMKKEVLPVAHDILVLISGPEPQRTYFEKLVKKALKHSKKRILIVRGVVEKEQIWTERKNIKMVNFMESKELEQAINGSEVIISRPGYSTVMDLSILEKKVFFIPTPGQYEQIYLAKRHKSLGLAPYCEQNKFRFEKLNEIPVYHGLRAYTNPVESFSKLFSLFHGE